MLSQLKAQVTAHVRDLARRGSDLLEAKLSLLEAKFKLALGGLQRVGTGFGIYALAGIVALVGFFTAVAAGCVSLAEKFGVPIALAITGGGLIVFAVVTVLIGKSILHAAELKAKRHYETAEVAARTKAAEALHPTGPRVGPDHLLRPGNSADPSCAPAPSSAKADNTLIALSAVAFAVSALVGPKKTARIIKQGASAAAKAAAAVKLARKTMHQNGTILRRVSSAITE